MKPSLYFELLTDFSANVYQAIEFYADEDAREGGSVRLNINPDLPWSPSALVKLAEALTLTSRALRVQSAEWRHRRLVRDAGFTEPPTPHPPRGPQALRQKSKDTRATRSKRKARKAQKTASSDENANGANRPKE